MAPLTVRVIENRDDALADSRELDRLRDVEAVMIATEAAYYDNAEDLLRLLGGEEEVRPPSE